MLEVHSQIDKCASLKDNSIWTSWGLDSKSVRTQHQQNLLAAWKQRLGELEEERETSWEGWCPFASLEREGY